MIVLTLEELAAINRNPSRLAVCVLVGPIDGVYTRSTTHDQPITVNKGALAGVYEVTKPITSSTVQISSNADAGNLEIQVGIDDLDMTEQEILAGKYRQIPYVMFVTDWESPNNVGIIRSRGTVGNTGMVNREVAKFELRELKQWLQQMIVNVVSRSCRVDLGSLPRFPGDEFCGVDLDDYRVSGVITLVQSRLVFHTGPLALTESANVSFPASESVSDANSGGRSNDGYYVGGLLTWTTGANVGYVAEVRTQEADSNGQVIQLFDTAPFDMQDGDTFDLVPGCNKSREDCRDKFRNIENMRAEPDAVDLSVLQEESPL